MTDEELKAVEARAEAARPNMIPSTEGPERQCSHGYERRYCLECLFGYGEAVRRSADDVPALVAEVRRLRQLIKDAETEGCDERALRSNCPWCHYSIGNWKRCHAPECPAFSEDGEVR